MFCVTEGTCPQNSKISLLTCIITVGIFIVCNELEGHEKTNDYRVCKIVLCEFKMWVKSWLISHEFSVST